MVHYLPARDFQKKIDSFDTNLFLKDVEDSGADYVIFTLGQNSGYLNSPNAAYDNIVSDGVRAYTPSRDIVKEIADGLHRTGKSLFLYLPTRGPQANYGVLGALGDTDERQPINLEFARNWGGVISEYAQRFGCQIAGWWFDGAYNLKNFESSGASKFYLDAISRGNNAALIAFNPGVNSHAFELLVSGQNMTAGEQNKLDIAALPFQSNGGRLHVVSFISSGWMRSDPVAYSPEFLENYMKKVLEVNGLFTIEVGIDPDTGKIYPGHLEFLKKVLLRR
ncbi:alpha-L-fucosidase [Curvibacter lanceolatus]|uniref:alpha-L-fucosidase n=1 Tax=Curvibacter lanceolatus TaxID=86182 RepID=UPI0012FC4B3D|nr:alpha-L-fucosidase [Curvibacter lanceolatus]